MIRPGRIGLTAFLALALSASASASWTAGGSGSGSGVVATMPAGNQPSASAAARDVTVTWTQSAFLGSPLGSYSLGGYTVARYASGDTTAITPGAACAGTITGSAATLQCIEAVVPYGNWRYAVTPLLDSFSGDEGPKSAIVAVATSAPSLTAATAQNPAAGESTGAIQLTWAAVTDATGYNVYRRTAAGSYDFASPLNAATPVTALSYTDPGAGLTGGSAYHYVVRALAGSPAAESASSNERNATTIARPAAPSGAVTATAAVGGRIDVGWTSVGGVAGYNVYRRTSAGSFDFNAPLNGATLVTGTSYADLTGVNGTSYVYVVRSVVIGAGSAQVESTSSAESNTATSDSTPPAVPLTALVNNGGPVQGSTLCGVAAGTRFINNAGAAAVSVTATIAAPETGQSVVFAATTPGSTPVTATAAATGTSVSTTMNLSTLLDGTVTLTARSQDAAGNLSATRSPTNVVVKDTVAAVLTGVTYNDRALVVDRILGTSQCGATITAIETAPDPGTFSMGPLTGSSFTLNVDSATLTAYAYTVTATDLAGNTSAATSLSGTAVL